MTPGRSLAGFDPACSPFSVENFLLYSSANSAILGIEGSAVAEDRFTAGLGKLPAGSSHSSIIRDLPRHLSLPL